jgi:uncharacterized repeat protein (TIGR01451 family)
MTDALCLRARKTVLAAIRILLIPIILSLSLYHPAAAATVTPSSPDDWTAANIAGSATVGMTTTQPRGDAPNNFGSLEFNSPDGSGKADYRKTWDPAAFPSRTLGNLTALSYEWYRDGSSTNPAVQAPALRIFYLTEANESGYLVYEPVYNEYQAGAPTNTWVSSNVFAGNLWMRAFGPPGNRTIDDYNVSLAEWLANTDEEGSPIDDDADSDVPHVLGPTTKIVGIEVGIGSGWNGVFKGFVDNIVISFGSDTITANFEPDICTTVCYVDAVNGDDANSGQTPTTAKKTIQAAVTQVSSGGTVIVAPGLYQLSARLDLNKPLTLLGPQADVDPRPSAATTRTPGDITTEAIIDGNGSLVNILRIAADDVTINGFEVRNGTGDLIDSLATAPIKNRAAVRYNIIHQATGDEGIQLRNVTDGVVEYNHIYNTKGDGINLCCSTTRSRISQNEVHNIDSTDGAIYIYDSTAMTVEHNLIYSVPNNDGIKLGSSDGSDATKAGGVLRNNIVHDTGQDGISIYMSQVTVSGNEIYNSNSTNGALYVAWNVNNVTVTRNNIHNNGVAGGTPTYGVRVGKNTLFPTLVTVNENCIAGNEAGLFYNAPDSSAVLDAQRNWWGAANGPGPIGPGSGDTIATANGGQVDFTSWQSGPIPGVCGCSDPGAVRNNDTGETFCTIQAAIDDSDTDDGDTLLVSAGVYPESPNITKSITLRSTAGRDLTEIVLQSGPTYLGALHIAAPTVTVEGFTITGADGTASTQARSNIAVTTAAKDVTITNNRFKVGQIDNGSTIGDDGFGLITYYDATNPPAINSLTVTNNEFVPLNAATGGRRAFYINPGVKTFIFEQNQITGKFTASALTQAQDGRVENNTVTGDGTSAGLGAWGYPDPTLWGHTTFRNNTISGVVNAISLTDVEGVLVEKNQLSGNGRGVRLALSQFTAGDLDSSTVQITRNNLANNSQAGIENTVTGDLVDGTCNWWGDASGPAGAGSGIGAVVSADVTFVPWLLTNDLNGPCALPKLTVIKNVLGPVPASDWNFSGPNGAFTLPAAGGSTTFSALNPGPYTISETAVPGYQTSVSCSNGAAGANSVGVTLGINDDVTCTFSNVALGKIIVEKQTLPDGATGIFTFTGALSGAIGDGGQLTLDGVVPGTYAVTEINPEPAFFTTNITCDDGASSTPSTWNLTTRTATFQVDAGETVKCVFTNTERSDLMVIKAPSTSLARMNETVTYTYRVINNGSLTIDNLVAVDDPLGPVTLATTTLAPSAETSGTLTYLVTEADLPGPLVNTVVVTGTPSSGPTVTVTDTATVQLQTNPHLTVVKTPNILNATVGSTVNYSYRIINSGDVTIHSLAAVDDKIGPLTLNTTTLAPGGETIASANYVVQESDLPGPLVNTVAVSALSPVNEPVTATQSAAVVLTSNSQLRVEKTPSVTTAQVGDTITYTYRVTNLGNVTLQDLVAVDDRLGPIQLGTTTLAASTSTTATKAYVVQESDLPGPLINTVVVTGTKSGGETIVGSTGAVVQLTSNPAITIEKSVDQSLAVAGDSLTYRYRVVNTGDVTLRDITLVDSKIGPVPIGVQLLPPGSVVTGTALYVVAQGDLPGPLVNTATVTGKPPAGPPVSASASASVTLRRLGLVLTTTVGVAGVGPACATSNILVVPVGTTVSYCYTVRNTGDVPLALHALGDSQLGALFTNVPFNLAPGESVSTADLNIPVRATITGNVTSIATWSATTDADAGLPGAPRTVTASAAATVRMATAFEDSDNDTIPDNVEGADDADDDGLPNFLDTDSDNDGIPDAEEAGPDPLNPQDSNGNGVPDFLEPFIPGAMLPKLYLPLVTVR